MSEVLTLKSVSCQARQDMLDLRFGDKLITVPYMTAFEILSGIRMAAKMAMRVEGNTVGLWRDLATIAQEKDAAKPARQFRRSRLQSNVKAWDINFNPDSPLVVLVFTPYPTGNPLQIKIHYSDALTFYSQMRIEARTAKAWAGDGSRIWNSAAHISDGEDNYKRGFK
jgi:hypothetical protein